MVCNIRFYSKSTQFTLSVWNFKTLMALYFGRVPSLVKAIRWFMRSCIFVIGILIFD